jgi:excisionase family DNA binding protein
MNTHAPLSYHSTTTQFLTVSQAARLLAVHPSSIRRWISAGKLPAYRVGDKGIRLSIADVLELARPLSRPEQKREPMEKAERLGIRPLTEEEQKAALAAVARARELQQELLAKYGMLTPEGWDLLNESRDERTKDLMRAVES